MFFMSLFASIVLTPLVLILTVWQGYALSVLVGWFLVPAFSIPPLSLVTASGICLICNLMSSKRYTPESTESPADRIWIVARNGTLVPFLALGFGWIIKSII